MGKKRNVDLLGLLPEKGKSTVILAEKAQAWFFCREPCAFFEGTARPLTTNTM
ncbi:protein of unknown function [Pseudodesulfovibrio piezophilus C1TLV30]|uniref:Uncharacterized protein n=1 Tax=Pseudodesulfovibrio piezophilus (strain DSM 21447 / JCM 15486 / C1TLV30) TaxID=1322246 RepID=M1WRE6_PSEP2|nr:protein of unknown function [Pseudodesulfovibrio piezophilus C1TLV30]